MELKTQAFYFDGQTSTPHSVELTLDDNKGELTFTVDADNTISNSIYGIDLEVYNNTMKICLVDNETHLVVNDRYFIDQLESLFESKVKISIFKKLIRLKFGFHLLFTLATISMIIIVYIFVTPVIAEKAVYLIPVAIDEQIGDMYMKNIINTVEIDHERTELLNEFSGKITWNSKLNLNFIVVESGTVNAFALPNGSIVVYTGLLDRIGDYETLLALLGHEVTHVKERHSMQTICKSLIGYALVSVLTTDVSAITAIILENSSMLGNLSYSRNMELDADNGAIILLERNNVNPRGMAKLMTILQDDGISFDARFEFLSTHPDMEKRIKNINSKLRGTHYPNNPELEYLFEKMR
jgi:predicted Zn-dependent protease